MAATPQNFGEMLAAFFRLHRQRWNARRSPGMIAGEGIERFHSETAARMLEKGRLRLYGLQVDGTIQGALYGFVYKKRFYSYLGGFNPELRNYSAGSVLIGHAVEKAIGEGVEKFDFLRGAEKYKYTWGAKDTTLRQLSFRPADLVRRGGP